MGVRLGVSTATGRQEGEVKMITGSSSSHLLLENKS